MSEEVVALRLSRIFNMDDLAERAMADGVLASLEDEYNLNDPMALEVAMTAIRDIERARKAMSPPGALGLPELLEKRRWEYGITDGAFAFQPFHDRILVWQTSRARTRESKTSLIELSDIGQKRIKESNPEGILVAAGLEALDQLRMNGIDLGHMVSFVRQAPWRKVVDYVEGKEFYVMIFRSGDLIGSEDLVRLMREGDVTIEFDEKEYQHFYKTKDGKVWRPSMANPQLDEDY